MKTCAGILTICVIFSLFPAASGAAPDDVAERRAEIIEAGARGAEAIPLLERALRDDSPMVRRAAIRGLISLGAPAEDAVRGALDNRDPLVRRAALMAVVGEPTAADLPRLETALKDEDPSVREVAVRLLLAMEPTDRLVELLEMAEDDEAPRVHKPAGLRLAELDPEAVPFEVEPPDTAPLRERPEMADRINEIETVFEMRLPSEGWRFRTDTRQRGHREEWFAEGYDDSDDDEWSDAEIETAWATGYVGVGWYRREIELPERPEHIAAELLFEGVDESAWVWVNGEYVGGQDVGPGGWNRPFRVDVTEQLRWDDVNQITVRAMNTAAAGGIWKPITLQALALE